MNSILRRDKILYSNLINKSTIFVCFLISLWNTCSHLAERQSIARHILGKAGVEY